MMLQYVPHYMSIKLFKLSVCACAKILQWVLCLPDSGTYFLLVHVGMRQGEVDRC